MAIEEVVVIAKRREGLPKSGMLTLQRFQGTGMRSRERQAPRPAGKKPIEEIVVTGKKAAAAGVALGTPIYSVSESAQKLKQLRGQRIWELAKRPIEEIVVKGKRSKALKAATRASRFNVLGLATFLGGALASELAREVSQRRLEDTFSRVMQDPKPKPDTPVRVKEPEPIDEIIVRGKRRSAPARPGLWTLPTFAPTQTFDMTGFQQDMMPKPAQPSAPAAPKISKPSVKKPSKTPALPAVLLFPGTITSQRPKRRAKPKTSPRSFLLGIGSPGTGFRDPLTPNLTGGNAPGVPLTVSSPVRSGTCAPCPSRKRKNDKRKRCYRKLVKEGLYPSRDKSYKWAEIDCLTGKEI